MGRFPWWTYDDAIRFDEAIASAKLILLSLWPGMNGHYFRIGQDISVRFTKGVATEIKDNDPEFFDANFADLDLEDDDRLALIEKSFDAIAARCSDGTRIFSLGCYTRGLHGLRNKRRVQYNRTCRDYCERHPERFRYVDADAIVPPEMMADDSHFLRPGYFALAQYILAVIRGHEPVLQEIGDRHAEEDGSGDRAGRTQGTQRRQEKNKRNDAEEGPRQRRAAGRNAHNAARSGKKCGPRGAANPRQPSDRRVDGIGAVRVFRESGQDIRHRANWHLTEL